MPAEQDPPAEIAALHALADRYDKAALACARSGLTTRGGADHQITHDPREVEEEALRRFQLADHLRKLATRQQVAAVVDAPPPTGTRALAHLLAAKVEGRTVGELLADAVAQKGLADCTLSAHGIRYLADEARVAIAQCHHELAKIFAGTPWDGFAYTPALQQLPATSAARVRIGGCSWNATLVPADLCNLGAGS